MCASFASDSISFKEDFVASITYATFTLLAFSSRRINGGNINTKGI